MTGFYILEWTNTLNKIVSFVQALLVIYDGDMVGWNSQNCTAVKQFPFALDSLIVVIAWALQKHLMSFLHYTNIANTSAKVQISLFNQFNTELLKTTFLNSMHLQGKSSKGCVFL